MFYFTPLVGVLFIFPSRYFLYRSERSILPWKVVFPDSDRISRVPSYSGSSLNIKITDTGLSPPLVLPFQITSLLISISFMRGPTTPKKHAFLVWAHSSSLAATFEISFDFFSCRYLDVSFPYVRSLNPIFNFRLEY